MELIKWRGLEVRSHFTAQSATLTLRIAKNHHGVGLDD